MTSLSAQIILDVIESANWPTVRSTLMEAGYKPAEIVTAGKELADLARRDNPFELGDFR